MSLIAGTLEYHESLPALHELQDVLYIPATPRRGVNKLSADGGLYTRDGRLWVECRKVRGPESALVFGTPDRIDPVPDMEEIAEDVLYFGYLPDHYGHLLTEGLSRAWSLVSIGWKGKVLFHALDASNTANNRDCLIRRMLTILGLEDRRIIVSDRPLRFRRVLVPDAALTNRVGIYRVFPAVFEAAARRLVDLRDRDARPLYLARTRGGTQPIAGEERLTEALEKRGVVIAHMQELPVPEQIRLVNRHSAVIGYVGSQMHNQIFSLTDRPTILLHGGESYVPNHVMIHHMKDKPLVRLETPVTRSVGSTPADIEALADSIIRSCR